jgi:hypothetical protein
MRGARSQTVCSGFRNTELGSVFTEIVRESVRSMSGQPLRRRGSRHGFRCLLGTVALAVLTSSCTRPPRACTVAEVDGGESNGCNDGEYCGTSAGGPCRALGCQGTCLEGCVTDADCGDAYVCNQGWCE